MTKSVKLALSSLYVSEFSTIETKYSNFESFCDSKKTKEFSLSNILHIVGSDFSCIVLGIDEVNKVYEMGVKWQDLRLIFKLIRLVDSLICEFSPFFIPVLAGTVIGPIKSAVREPRYLPLHIPLPLLSFESC